MENYGLVSIITPNKNCALFIYETIHSVQAQTYQNWELIIVDDCSSDGSEEVVKPYMERDARIRLLQNSANSGVAVSRNYALREAKGRWIAFLDSDDLWHPEKLERQLRFMVEKGYAFSYTQYAEISEAGMETGTLVSGPRRLTRWGITSYCWLGCLTVMYDRDRVGLVQVPDIKKNNDYAMWLEISRKADCFLLPECLAQYRRGRVGSVSTNSYATMIRWHYKMWHEAEAKNPIAALLFTSLNMLCGVWKKFWYVKHC